MREWTVRREEKEQRFNKYLQRKLPGAPSSFLYKMLRKKNITLNGKKASGSELLQEGDLVTLFLSDETIGKFGGTGSGTFLKEDTAPEHDGTSEFERAYRQLRGRIGEEGILYEDDHLLAVRKPVGILSQKASDSDVSMNEWLVGYLLEKGAVNVQSLKAFRPSVCNRLDRNTGGILICSKSLAGARKAGELLRNRTLHKYYRAVVLGTVSKGGRIEGFTGIPRFVRGNRGLQCVYVNDRLIRSKTISAAIDEAYKNAVMKNKFPICFLMIYCAPGTVDVNVHPQKAEVKFASDNDVFRLVLHGIRNAITSSGTITFQAGFFPLASSSTRCRSDRYLQEQLESRFSPGCGADAASLCERLQ